VRRAVAAVVAVVQGSRDVEQKNRENQHRKYGENGDLLV
jgi:hypothetical protein